MPASHCLTASMLSVGMQHESEFSFSHEDVARYLALSGDGNAIHHDVEAARLRFPGVTDIVVPGGLIQIAITGLFGTVLPGDGSLGLTFTPARFRKPVCPGDRISVLVEITRVRGEIVELDVAIRDRTGSRIGSATARVLAPDAGYRAWWEAHAGAAD